MSISISFIQVFFTIICVLFSISFTTSFFEGGFNWINSAVGLIGGCAMSLIFFGIDAFFKRFNLRSFNTAALGIFFGFIMGKTILFTLGGILGWEDTADATLPVRFMVYLTTCYFGLVMMKRAVEEIHLSIPFVEFKQTSHKKKDIILDLSILTDSRIIDLASSGLLDHQLIIPRCGLKELYSQAESTDEAIKSKARRSLDVVKKLEMLPSLDLRFTDTDFPEIKEPMAKLIRLARFMDANVITSDINRIQQSMTEGVRIINIHMLSNALKPITQAGEAINIKIQRYGKEARQGVGYLEDGTMVVVNGGAEFIGETIKAHVLSVKHTSSGRMIFCNAAEEGNLLSDQDFPILSAAEEEDQKSFFAL